MTPRERDGSCTRRELPLTGVPSCLPTARLKSPQPREARFTLLLLTSDRASEHPMHPTMGVGGPAALDVDQGGAQRLGLSARVAVADGEHAVLELDPPDRRQHRGGTAREGLPRRPLAASARHWLKA